MSKIPVEFVNLVFLRLGGRGRRSYTRASQDIHPICLPEDEVVFNTDNYLIPYNLFFIIITMLVFALSIVISALTNSYSLILITLVLYFVLVCYYTYYTSSKFNDFANFIANREYTEVINILSQSDKDSINDYYLHIYNQNKFINTTTKDITMTYYRNKYYIIASDIVLSNNIISRIKSYCRTKHQINNVILSFEDNYKIENSMYPIVKRLVEAKLKRNKVYLAWIIPLYIVMLCSIIAKR